MQNNDNLFRSTYNQIVERKERLERGGINTIPFPFPALNKFVPGIMPETQIGLTTVSGAGKSLFATNIYVQHPFKEQRLYGYRCQNLFLLFRRLKRFDNEENDYQSFI